MTVGGGGGGLGVRNPRESARSYQAKFLVKKLWSMFFGCVEKYALFDTTFSQITRVGRAATFSQITRDWRVAVLDQTDPSAELRQALFWASAQRASGHVPARYTRWASA